MVDMSGKDTYSCYPNIHNSNNYALNYINDEFHHTVYYIEKLKSMGYTEKQIRELLRKENQK